MNFGPHLLGELAGITPEWQDETGDWVDFDGCSALLIDTARTIGMRAMGRPHVDWYQGSHPEWKGPSGTLHIETSHITMHLFAFGHAFVDIFSCRPFDEERAKEFLEDALRPRSVHWIRVDRGLLFPPELSESAVMTGE